MSEKEHEEIMEEIARRAALEHTRCWKMNMTATVIHTAAAVMTVTVTVMTKAAQITSKIRTYRRCHCVFLCVVAGFEILVL